MRLTVERESTISDSSGELVEDSGEVSLRLLIVGFHAANLSNTLIVVLLQVSRVEYEVRVVGKRYSGEGGRGESSFVS